MKFDLQCPDCGTILFKIRDAEGLKGWCPYCRDSQGNARVWQASECKKMR